MNCPYRMVSNLTDLNPSVGFNVGAIHELPSSEVRGDSVNSATVS